jgi:hypothetical protein
MMAATRVPKDGFVGVGDTGYVTLESGAPFAFMLYGKPREVTRNLETSMRLWTAATVIVQVREDLPGRPTTGAS